MSTILSIGTQVRQARKAKKMSADKLSQLASVHANTLRSLEKGTGNIELSRLISIASELGFCVALVPKEMVNAPLPQENLTLSSFAMKMEKLSPGLYKK